MSTMQALRVGGPRGLSRLESVDQPECGPGDALVRMVRATVSGDDVRVAKEMREPESITMGREGVGEVVEVGEGADASLVGARVTFESSFPCRACELCRRGLSAHCRERFDLGEAGGLDGCFAEYVRVPASGIVRLPDGIDDERALNAGLFARARHAGVRVRIEGRPFITVLGDAREALVMGQVMSKLNAQVRVIGWDQDRLGLCEKWGVRHRHADEPGLHEDQDVVIDCAGTYESVEMAMAMIRPRGTILACAADGLMVHASAVVGKELDVLGSWGVSISDGVALLGDSSFQTAGLITKRVTFDKSVEGLHAMAKGELGVSIEF